jgi:cysteine-S-conjugate beta-lyase
LEKKIATFDTKTYRENSDAEKYTVREKLFGREDIYPMWVADMEYQASPAIQKALKARVEHGVFGYAMPDEVLFSSAVLWWKKRHNMRIDDSLFRASPSIMTSMSAAIEALSKVGEGITTLVPVYPPFMEVVTTQDRILHTVDLEDNGEHFSIDFLDLEEALKQSSIFLLCNPHNPVGRVWKSDELEQIALLCEKYQVSIISDDAHSDLIMPNFSYTSITTISEYTKNNTITLFGPGKGFNISGLAATLCFSFSKIILKKFDKVVKARHIVSGQMMGYHAINAAYNDSDAWLEELLPYIDNNLSYATEKLNALEGFKVYKSEGTYLLWINCKGLGLSDLKLKAFFVEKAGLGLSLGRLFGSSGSGFVRMNCAVPFEDLQRAISQVESAINNCSEIHVLLLNEGIDVWKKVQAKKINQFKYRIVSFNSTKDDELWQFNYDDIVDVKKDIKGLVAYQLSK